MAEARLVIEGQEYPVPDLSELNMDEAMIIKKYTGLNLDEFEQANGSDPTVVAALVHVAFAAASPNESFATIERRVKKVRLAHIEQIGGEDDAVPVPPAEAQNAPRLASVTPDGSEPSSGPTSAEPSAETPDTGQPPTGRPDSGTGTDLGLAI